MADSSGGGAGIRQPQGGSPHWDRNLFELSRGSLTQSVGQIYRLARVRYWLFRSGSPRHKHQRMYFYCVRCGQATRINPPPRMKPDKRLQNTNNTNNAYPKPPTSALSSRNFARDSEPNKNKHGCNREHYAHCSSSRLLAASRLATKTAAVIAPSTSTSRA